MANSKTTKRALLSSAVSLLLCFTMLMGATFAWFTDNVSSTGNRIQAGTLEVDLVMDKLDGNGYLSIADSSGDIFSEATGNGINWEPGKTEIVYLGVRNNGSLALKYNILLNVIDEGLIGSLEYAILDGVEVGNELYNRLQEVSDWETLKAIGGVQPGDVEEGQKIVAENGVLDEIVNGEDKETDYFALAVHMKEEAGNEYQGDSITIDVIVNATQKDAEFDSFGNDYDIQATYPTVAAGTVEEGATAGIVLTAGEISVSIPVEAGAGAYRLEVSDKKTTVNGEETTLSYDISLYKDGVEVDGDISYPVSIAIGTMLDIDSPMAYDYDAMAGIISFEIDSFGPFTLRYTKAGEDVDISDGKIVGGTFTVNPVQFDESLDDADSEYIAINYKKDGKTYYVVSKRTTTVILAAPDTSYTSENGNYTVESVASNGLYSQFSALSENAHTTVYMLPGTYQVDTVVYVYSSMDIIGLGDKNTVKVIKGASSKSNRHIFNCSGTKSEYINVTLRNLYLDASAKNDLTNFMDKDNGAVQSIRKSKVKCYDLTVVKGTDFGYAFYVNGNNAVDGVKYPAYMYVENCTIDTNNNSYIVTTSGTYKFYHNNLTYNNGNSSYTQNSGSILNKEPNDWEW